MAGNADRIEQLARLGFAARGVVYLLIGWFALRAAEAGSRPSDSQGALSSLAGGGAGRILLALVALGLFGYGLWRILDAALQQSAAGKDSALARAGHAVSGIAHVLLGLFAANLAMSGSSAGSSGNAQDASARDWTGWLLSQPFGEALVVLLGIALIAVGLYQWLAAYRASFMKHLGGDAPRASWLLPAGRIGFAARGLVFVLIGGFIVSAGKDSDAGEAGGMAQALATLQAQPSGTLLLGVTALGLIMFGIFSFVEAAYRRIDAPNVPNPVR